ncbi:pyocin knob domain-containing protein [Pelosinus baikalensis]|uniref:Putative tail fiber protein gp53-like C-terminal domain-containing protein n=1 Tax=Pelosinus baikalensis TaxID=2892015 RepID=A0ABS8HQ71_9FIRM|nr:hypothetical protein [Pelosinus baikalensis]MCC5464801.1 hypothetical protein [Pelosinus baikalensis]
MAYDATKPEDTGFLSEAPNELRNNFKGLKEDQIVDAALLKGLVPGNGNGQIPVNNGTECENLNAAMLSGKTPSDFAPKVHTHNTVTVSSDGFMTAAQNNKLAGIATNAEVNQMAFSNVLVGSTTIQADSKTDTLEMVAGTNIAIIPDAANDRVTIGVSGKVGSAATADSCIGNSATATKLTTARTIATSGDAIGAAVAFDGTANVTIPLTLAASGVAAGTYKSVTVDAKGRTIAGTNPTKLSEFGIVDAFTKLEATANFAPGSYGLGTLAKDISGQGISVIKGKSGFYRGNNVGSAPNSNWWYFNVIAHDPNSYTTVEAINFFGTDKYTARWDNGNWSGWTRIVTANMIPANALGDAGSYFAANGYQRLSNGLILQWGSVNQTGNTSTLRSFPIVFPNDCLCCFGGKTSPRASAADGNSAGAYKVSNIQFQTYADDNGSDTLSWLAIGY